SCTAASCSADKGSQVVLTAPPVAGYRFAGWSGDAGCSGAGATLAVTVTAPLSCTASYVARFSVTGAVGGGLSGAVTATSPDGNSTCAGPTCAADAGKAVTLVAPTIDGYRLVGWSGAGCSAGTVAGSGLTLVAAADLTCTAKYVLGVSVSGTV